MLDKDLAYKILKEAVDYSPADETEVILQGGKDALTRFANNYIHQNVMQKDYSLMVRTVFGKRAGIASCNIFDGTKLKELVDTACKIAKHSEEDHGWVSVPSPAVYQEFPNSYFEQTMDFSPQDREKAVETVVRLCKEKKLIAAGTFSNGDSMLSVMNNKGLFAYHKFTGANFTLTAMADNDSSGWSEYHCSKVEEIMEIIEDLTKIAINKALLNKNPIALPQGEYTVILEECAVKELVMFLSYLAFGGLTFNEGRSFMSDKIGEKIMGDNITISDDARNTEVLGVPFDFEGNSRKKLIFIENGIAKDIAHDRKSAVKAKIESTGHGLPPSSSCGAIPINLILGTGDSSLEEMIKTTEKGVLITRFWYDNVVDEKRAIITGMTRDGTFLIENGQIVNAVRNMRYNEALPDLFKRVIAISKERKSFSGEFMKIAVPALKIANFHFTGVSADVSGDG